MVLSIQLLCTCTCTWWAANCVKKVSLEKRLKLVAGGEEVLVGAVRPLVKFKHADQPGNKRATPCLIHVLPLLNRRGWKQLIFQKCVCLQDVLCCVMESVMWYECWFCGRDKGAFYPNACWISIHCICIILHYTRIETYALICTSTGSRCSHCVHCVATGRKRLINNGN